MTLSTLFATIKTALETITGVKDVSTDITRFNGAKDYPVLYYELNNSGTEWISFPQATVTDREAKVELSVYGALNPRYAKNIEANTIALIGNVEGAINGILLNNADIVDVRLSSQRNDIDINNSFGYFQAVFEIVYLYNRLSP